jgi:hypothetical protein
MHGIESLHRRNPLAEYPDLAIADAVAEGAALH